MNFHIKILNRKYKDRLIEINSYKKDHYFLSTPFTLMLHHLKLFSLWVSQQPHLQPLEHSDDSAKPVPLLTHSEHWVDLTCYCSYYITCISYVWLGNVPTGSYVCIFDCQLGMLYRNGRWCLIGGSEDRPWGLGSTLLLELSLLLVGTIYPPALQTPAVADRAACLPRWMPSSKGVSQDKPIILWGCYYQMHCGRIKKVTHILSLENLH